jgi:hypothetical protein
MTDSEVPQRPGNMPAIAFMAVIWVTAVFPLYSFARGIATSL